jgi:hypothetical protein
MSICLAGARAEASRRNGAKSSGPRTPDGKARSSRNALKHGLRAQKFVVVGDESAQEFAALEAALSEELAPDGALQGLLASRIARAAWRLERAERIEAEPFVRHADRDRNLGLALIRDGHGSRAFDTLLRYRGSALAELWRALRLLKALQAEVAPSGEAAPTPNAAPPENPIEPEGRGNPREITPPPAAPEPETPCRRADHTRPVPAAERHRSGPPRRCRCGRPAAAPSRDSTSARRRTDRTRGPPEAWRNCFPAGRRRSPE